ncbi:MAG: ribbon-helix-helix protein, CopG family [Dehalococcoidia bacterium]
MVTRQRRKRPFDKVYSSVPREVKEAIQEEADRRGLQISDVVRELLMEKYANRSSDPGRSPAS